MLNQIPQATVTFSPRIDGVRVVRGRPSQIGPGLHATPASGFSPTLPMQQASHVDVMVLGDLHLREDSMDAFCEARDQMKVSHVFRTPSSSLGSSTYICHGPHSQQTRSFFNDS